MRDCKQSLFSTCMPININAFFLTSNKNTTYFVVLNEKVCVLPAGRVRDDGLKRAVADRTARAALGGMVEGKTIDKSSKVDTLPLTIQEKIHARIESHPYPATVRRRPVRTAFPFYNNFVKEKGNGVGGVANPFPWSMASPNVCSHLIPR